MCENENGLTDSNAEPVRKEEEERYDECRDGDPSDGGVCGGELHGDGVCTRDDARYVESDRVADETSRDASGASLWETETKTETASAETVTEKADERKKAREELYEFFELFPSVSFSEIPAEVRESPLPLSAAYALYERKRERLAERAEAANNSNRARSAGGITGGEESFYSPDEVRRMTREEVRADFDAVMRSMKKWK